MQICDSNSAPADTREDDPWENRDHEKLLVIVSADVAKMSLENLPNDLFIFLVG